MRPHPLQLIVALAGCNRILDVHDFAAIDAVVADEAIPFDADCSSNVHDEDGDSLVDVCDPCPTVAAQDPANLDNDALPDACDPHPAIPGDTIGAFYPFDVPLTNFVPVSGSAPLQVTGDELHIEASSTTTQIVVVDVGFANQGLVIGVDAQTVHTNELSVVSAMIGSTVDAATYVGCGLRFDTKIRELFDYDGSKPAAQQFTSLSTDNTSPDIREGQYAIGMVAGATSQACVIQDPGSHLLTGNDPQRTSNTFVGIRARNAKLAIKYLIAYRF